MCLYCNLIWKMPSIMCSTYFGVSFQPLKLLVMASCLVTYAFHGDSRLVVTPVGFHGDSRLVVTPVGSWYKM